MAGLEQVVRPFQRPDALARRRIVAKREKIEVGTAVISWGKSGNLTQARQIDAVEPLPPDFKIVHFEHWREEARQSKDYRITQKIANADGSETEVPENYVDVSRPDWVRFKRTRDTSKGGGPDEMANRNAKQVYADTNRDSAAMQPFVSLADRSVNRQATYELSNDPTGTRIPDGGQSAP